MDKDKLVAELLFPGVVPIHLEVKDLVLRKESIVTRFAPSPTGFIHLGGLFAALVSERLAHQGSGVFFLRIEDTDKKREVEDGVQKIINAVTAFGINIDEGVMSEHSEIGEYGPYKQSERKSIYAKVVKHLLENGYAYPCFCSSEDLEATRKVQEIQKIRTGYYSKWAIHRNISLEEIKENLSRGKSFVVRLKSSGDINNKFTFRDLIKGEVTLTDNDQDVVLLKSDKLPTYHFAHVVDDYFMGTTHIVRGDEWLSSLPIHLQLFKILGWRIPKYAHLSPILKLDAGVKRKLSKRKDAEAAADYYLEKGYPVEAVIEYLINIANSDFEDWKKQNPNLPNSKFEIRLDKFNKSGALLDSNKLIYISKDVIARMSPEDVYAHTLKWALDYDSLFANKLKGNRDYFLKIFAIERNISKPRKDLGMWSDVKESVFYFFEDLFKDHIINHPPSYPEIFSKKTTKEIIIDYISHYRDNFSKDEWFSALKEFSELHGFAKEVKVYKQDSSSFKGHVGDVAMILRVAITSMSKAPDLYEIMKVMGKERVKERLQFSADRI